MKKYLKRLKLTEFPQPEIIQLNYPVLLCHGYGGLSMLVKPSPLHDPCLRLRSYGILAFAPNIVPYATISIRAEQWAERIEQLKQKYGFEKMNVIAHSMGGLDMRYAITAFRLSGSVASLTTIGAPHYGTSLAEIVLNTPESIKERLGELFDWFGQNIFPSKKSDAVAAVEQLTREYVTREFNPNTPNAKGVLYYSYNAAVGKGTDQPLNPVYRFQNQFIYQHEGINDAFVSKQSAVWGQLVDTLPVSHLEQIEIQTSKERKPLVEKMWMDVATHLKSKGL